LFDTGGTAQTGLSGTWGGRIYSGGGGAGVNTREAGDTTNKATTSVIKTSLSDAMYLKVFNDVTGGPGADLRVFSQAMGNGNDLIDAGAGNDWVLAGGGDDTITGGIGSDVMWGGLGADNFKFNLTDFDGSVDVIKDFSNYQSDSLVFSGITLATVDSFVKLVSDVSAKKTTLLIDTSGERNFASPTNSIVLENSIEFQTMEQLKSAMVFS
jgi:Ca2+-binding RTX toxin-like protein